MASKVNRRTVSEEDFSSFSWLPTEPVDVRLLVCTAFFITGCGQNAAPPESRSRAGQKTQEQKPLLIGRPKFYRLVRRAGDQDFAARVEGSAADRIRVPLEGSECFARGGVPDARGVIVPARHHLVPVRAEGDREDDSRVPLEGGDLFPLRGVVDLGEPIVAGDGDPLPVGGKLYVGDDNSFLPAGDGVRLLQGGAVVDVQGAVFGGD